MRRSVLLLGLLLGIPLAVWAGTPAKAAGHAVTMSGYAFGPATLEVTAGDTVTWTNQDTAGHDVTTTSAPVSFHSRLLSKGQSFSYRLTVPGRYQYYCSVHPDMRAQVVVHPVPASPTPAQGQPRPAHTTGTPVATPTGSTVAVAGPATVSPSAPPPAVAAAPAAPAGPDLRPLTVATVATVLAALVSLLALATRPPPRFDEPGTP